MPRSTRPADVSLFPVRVKAKIASASSAVSAASSWEATPGTHLIENYGTVLSEGYNSRGGIGMNLEQQLMPNVGLFVRAGIADGDKEPYEFTDVDRTVAAGLSISGKQWGRDDDTFGIAGVVNGISGVHQAYLNAGGLGILIGDGMLPHPAPEQIVEAYYQLPVSFFKLTLDYQFIVNPAYNSDRGPVSVVATRLHAQF